MRNKFIGSTAAFMKPTLNQSRVRFEDAKWRYENHFKDVDSLDEYITSSNSYIKALEKENEELTDQLDEETLA